MTEWAWASHQPLLESAMTTYNPDFVFESGIGLYSTPILSKAKTYLGVDTDSDWIAAIHKHQPELELIHHKISVGNANRFWSLSWKEQAEIKLFYFNLLDRVESVSGVKLLFIDGATCTRFFVFQALAKYFDIVILHDSQPRARAVYGYDRMSMNGWYQHTLKSDTAWSEILTKKVNIIPKTKIDSEIELFSRKWSINPQMQFV